MLQPRSKKSQPSFAPAQRGGLRSASGVRERSWEVALACSACQRPRWYHSALSERAMGSSPALCWDSRAGLRTVRPLPSVSPQALRLSSPLARHRSRKPRWTSCTASCVVCPATSFGTSEQWLPIRTDNEWQPSGCRAARGLHDRRRHPLEDRHRRTGQREAVRLAAVHAPGPDGPDCGVEVDLLPSCAPDLAAAGCGQDGEHECVNAAGMKDGASCPGSAA